MKTLKYGKILAILSLSMLPWSAFAAQHRSSVEKNPDLISALTRPGECPGREVVCDRDEKNLPAEQYAALTRPGECGVGETFCHGDDSEDSTASSAH